MSRVTVYSTANCSFCNMTKVKLEQWNIPFDEIRIDQDPATMQEFATRTNGARTVPQILIDGNQIQGTGADRYGIAVTGRGLVRDLRLLENRVGGFYQGAVRTWAVIDRITVERNFIFGIGLGYRDVEFNAFAVPKGKRVARFEENLELVKRLWTEDSVTHHGETCILEDVRMNIRPIQRPHPPVWIAANNERAIRRAARLGDTWFINPHSTIGTLAEHMAA